MGIAANLANSIYIFSDIAMAVFAVAIIYPMLNKKEKAIAYTFWAMVCFILSMALPLVLLLAALARGKLSTTPSS